MTDNTTGQPAFDPYAAPRAAVADVPGSEEAVFYPVGLFKLAVLGAACLGFYHLFWFYQNWKCARRLGGEAFSVPLRALFYPLTAFFLFRRIEAQRREHAAGGRVDAGVLAVLLLACTLMFRLPDPYWLLALLHFVPLLPAQIAVNALNAKLAPGVDPNRRWGPGSVLALLLGGSITALAVIGALFGDILEAD
jgi:hypothetical protein